MQIPAVDPAAPACWRKAEAAKAEAQGKVVVMRSDGVKVRADF